MSPDDERSFTEKSPYLAPAAPDRHIPARPRTISPRSLIIRARADLVRKSGSGEDESPPVTATAERHHRSSMTRHWRGPWISLGAGGGGHRCTPDFGLTGILITQTFARMKTVPVRLLEISPAMAEAVHQRWRGEFRVFSAGIRAMDGQPPTPHSVRAATANWAWTSPASATADRELVRQRQRFIL